MPTTSDTSRRPRRSASESEVASSPGTSNTYDEEKKRLKESIEKIDAAVTGRLDVDRDEYEIGTSVGRRRLKHIPITDLIRLRELYSSELRKVEFAEKAAKGFPTGKKIIFRLP